MKEHHWLKEHWLILLTGVVVGIATLPCLRLTLPTAERVVVFHHLVVAHAGRTRKRAAQTSGSLGSAYAFPLIS